MNVLGEVQESEKELINIDKDGNESVVTLSYKLKFIDSARFTGTSSSNLVDNLIEAIYQSKCKDCGYFLKYEKVQDNLLKCKYLCCNKYYSKINWRRTKDTFKDTFKFSNNDIIKFIMSLSKCSLPCQYMDDWEKFNERTLPEKRRSLWQLKYRRYYRCRLDECEKSL